jgi:hypothetical protein
MAGWQDMNGSSGQTFTSNIAHNILSAEEKVDILKSEGRMVGDEWSQSEPFRPSLDKLELSHAST